MVVVASVDVGDGGEGKRRWTRVGDGCARVTRDEIDGIVDGGNRVVVMMGSVTGVVDALGSLEDEGLDGLEETALAV